MNYIKSYIVKLNGADPSGGGLSTVVTDGVTVQGDGSVGSPVAVIPGVFFPLVPTGDVTVTGGGHGIFFNNVGGFEIYPTYVYAQVVGYDGIFLQTTKNEYKISPEDGELSDGAGVGLFLGPISPGAANVDFEVSGSGYTGPGFTDFYSRTSSLTIDANKSSDATIHLYTQLSVESDVQVNLRNEIKISDVSGILLKTQVQGIAIESADDITVTGADGFRGIEYAADYSADYTDRSLVDKAYVDSVAGGGGSFASITGDPYDNTNLSAALNLKLNALTEVRSPTISGAHTLDATDLAAISAGKDWEVLGDNTGGLTVPLNATVAFPVGTYLSLTGFTSVVATGGVTLASTRGGVDYTIPSGYTGGIYKSATNNWALDNGLPDASSSTRGLAKLYTATGSNTDGAMDQNSATNAFAAKAGSKVIQIAFSDPTSAITAGTNKVKFRMPYAMTLTAIRMSLGTAQASGSIFTVDVNESGTTILSTKLTIDNTEKTSTTAATPAVISDAALADDAEITIDVDQVGDGSAVAGVVTLIGY